MHGCDLKNVRLVASFDSLPCISGKIDACLAYRKENIPLSSNLLQTRYLPPCLFNWGSKLKRDRVLALWCGEPFDLLMYIPESYYDSDLYRMRFSMTGIYCTGARKSHASLVPKIWPFKFSTPQQIVSQFRPSFNEINGDDDAAIGHTHPMAVNRQ